MNKYVLFTGDYLASPGTMITANTDQEGGTMRIKGGSLVDGKLLEVNIKVTDGSQTKFSALSDIVGCKVECHDLVLEGRFSGEIVAYGDVEIGESAQVEGTIHHAGRLLVNGLLADTVDLRTKKIAAKPLDKAADVATISY